MDAQRGSRSRTVVALVAVVVLVVSLLGVGAVIASHDDEPGAPASHTNATSPVLDLSRTSNTGTASAPDSAAALGAGPYELEGTLGTTTEEGVVIDPATSTATEAQVRVLLAALGMKSPTVEQVKGEGWTATGTAAGARAAFALDQKAGNVWQYARGPLAQCLSIRPGAAPDDAVSCAAADSVTPQPDATNGPGKAALLREAKEVFDLVGITPGKGLVAREDGEGATSLAVPITVEGLPVVDVTVNVSVDQDGIVAASGWLDPTFTTIGRYPLISATDGFVDLAGEPRPAIGQVCPTPAGVEDAAGCSQPQKVTAARLAWLTTQNGGHLVLVPAWQFEVDGFYGPAVVAVVPQFLGGGGGSAEPATPGSGSGAGSAEPGTAEPAPAPATVVPPTDKKIN